MEQDIDGTGGFNCKDGTEKNGKYKKKLRQNECSSAGSTDSAEDPDWKLTATVSIPQDQAMVSLLTLFGYLEEDIANVNYSTTTSSVLERVETLYFSMRF